MYVEVLDVSCPTNKLRHSDHNIADYMYSLSNKNPIYSVGCEFALPHVFPPPQGEYTVY